MPRHILTPEERGHRPAGSTIESLQTFSIRLHPRVIPILKKRTDLIRKKLHDWADMELAQELYLENPYRVLFYTAQRPR
jgi:hypothetical protein